MRGTGHSQWDEASRGCPRCINCPHCCGSAVMYGEGSWFVGVPQGQSVIPHFLHKPLPVEHCAVFPRVLGYRLPSFPPGVFLPVFYIGAPPYKRGSFADEDLYSFLWSPHILGGSCLCKAALGFVPGWNHRYLVSLQV